MHKAFSFFIITLLLSACNLSGLPDNSEESLDVDVVTITPPQDATETATPPVTRTALPTSLPIPTSGVPTGIAPATSIIQQPTPIPAALVFQPPAEGQRAFGLHADDNLSGGGLNLLNINTWHFAQDPQNRNRYAVIDAAGLLYVTDAGGANAFRIEQGPYTQFPATSRETNNAAAELSAWSPNGQYLAFIVAGRQLAGDGMWYFEPGQFGPLQLLVDCPFEGFIGCNIVTPSDSIRFWESKELYWSPDSQAILVNVNLPEQGRRGLIVNPITRDERVRDRRPPILLYDYGTWGNDGRILASGRNPEGSVAVVWINRDGSQSQPIYPAGLNGLWMGWAVQRTNGDIFALGRPGEPNGPVALYNMNGDQLTGFIGDGFPQRVDWSPDRRAVLLTINGRQYVATLTGQITEITPNTGGLAVSWVQ